MKSLRDVFNTKDYKFGKIDNFVVVKERLNGVGILPVLIKDETQSAIDILKNGQKYKLLFELYVLIEDCGGCASFDYYYPITFEEYKNPSIINIKFVKKRFNDNEEWDFSRIRRR